MAGRAIVNEAAAAETAEGGGRNMFTYRCDQWNLLAGVRVQLRLSGRPVRIGYLEAATADSSALWLSAEGVERRALYIASEGYEVWIDPGTLPDSVYAKVICHTPDTSSTAGAEDKTES